MAETIWRAFAQGLALLMALLLALLLPKPAWAQASSTTALVLPEQLPLRAAPRDSAPLLTPLVRGEALELRAVRGQWLQVWDHGRERGGFVRASALLQLEATPAALLAQLRLVRQQAGAESLGLGLAAALIERADADWLASPQGAEMLGHLVALHESLAQRANASGGSPAQQALVAAQVGVAARYGQPLRSLAQADGSQLQCAPDAPARWLRALPSAPAALQAQAALALTRAECAVGNLEERLAWLQGIDETALPSSLRKALRLRRAGVQASLAFAARSQPTQARRHAQAALADWLRLNPAELDDDDAPALREAAIRLVPMRWLAQAPATQLQRGKLLLQVEAGAPGQTCVRVAGQPRHCSHGLVHLNSLRSTPDGQSLLLAVQPLEAWTELWRLGSDGSLQVLPPASEAPGSASTIGAVEWAGDDRGQLLVAREAWLGNKALRRFEVLSHADLLAPAQRWAGEPGLLAAFQRSAEAAWKAGSPLAR